ncbi:hypothetical protein TEA_013633 [Camellia sinensis var. sinensis]|uniref:Association with the SNF1 complex (ASC) domain-containing protein n=1 Tax=Camellia sinensis var. sinensis TaxID=542762 RepID=A0A4S4DQ23_CAMSN|nr:hypothetical protein TEA_013633 [Camellia sinensis var. sinensis]
MGNVNGREDGASGLEQEGGGDDAQDSMAAHGGAQVSYRPYGDGELMPPIPGAAHSPLMFTPQAMLPLQRPDEMHAPSYSLMQNTTRFEDTCSEQGIPTMITWSYDGKEVAVEGSWDDWKTRMPLQRSGKDFTIMKVLPSGVFQYKFIVDGQWRYAPDMPWAQDETGNAYNILDLQLFLLSMQLLSSSSYLQTILDNFPHLAYTGGASSFLLVDFVPILAQMAEVAYDRSEAPCSMMDYLIGAYFIVQICTVSEFRLSHVQDYVPEDVESISGFEPPQSPDSSYNNFQLGSEDFAKEPPLVPPHLQMTLLNVPSSYVEVPPPLSRPQHVVLNHLYMQKGRSSPSVVALGSTHRFIAKYVTVVLYKSIQR